MKNNAFHPFYRKPPTWTSSNFYKKISILLEWLFQNLILFPLISKVDIYSMLYFYVFLFVWLVMIRIQIFGKSALWKASVVKCVGWRNSGTYSTWEKWLFWGKSLPGRTKGVGRNYARGKYCQIYWLLQESYLLICKKRKEYMCWRTRKKFKTAMNVKLMMHLLQYTPSYKQLGLGPAPQSCLHSQDFQVSRLFSYYLVSSIHFENTNKFPIKCDQGCFFISKLSWYCKK